MTKRSKFQFGHWEVVCCPEDGARLHSLRYHEIDLLTPEPESFKAPATDYGQYETRPVYGYDDCFPTVDRCPFPGLHWDVPDHGELCWRQWEEATEPHELICSVRSDHLPIHFVRRMQFSGTSLTWTFQVVNHGQEDLPFLHVMHPLMPLKMLTALHLPAAGRVVDEFTGKPLETGQVADWLQALPTGQAAMLLLQDVEAGEFAMGFDSGLTVKVSFPLELFPTIGIWWNRDGYPDEAGCRRNEFAVEPIPGPCSKLSACAQAGNTLIAPGGGHLEWSIIWTISHV